MVHRDYGIVYQCHCIWYTHSITQLRLNNDSEAHARKRLSDAETIKMI
jgi:hypothetical protein